MRLSNDFWQGVAGTLAAAPGIFAFGIITGVAMIGAGLTPVAAMAMSLIAYAGSAQLVALQLMLAGAPLLVIFLAALIVNLRFVLYSLAVGPNLPPVKRRERLLLAYLLSDNGYAHSAGRFVNHPGARASLDHLLGTCAVVWLSWEIGTLIGVIAGSAVPSHWGLEFVVTLTFLGFGVTAISDRATLAAFVGAGIVALLTWSWPYRLGLIAAALAGIACGMMLDRHRTTAP